MVDNIKLSLSSITVQSLVAVSHIVWAYYRIYRPVMLTRPQVARPRPEHVRPRPRPRTLSCVQGQVKAKARPL